MTTPELQLSDELVARARVLGVMLGRLDRLGGDAGASLQTELRKCQREFQSMVKAVVGRSRWWWWAVLVTFIINLFILTQPYRFLAEMYFSSLFLWILLAWLVESDFRKRRRAATSALAKHVQEATDRYLLAEATRVERNRRREEKREEQRIERRKTEQRQRQQERRDEAMRSGVPPELVCPPGPLPGHTSPRGAEFLAAQWIRALGEPSARVTSFVGDGGVDVESDNYLAQVKHYRGKVGPAPIRELVGVSRVDGRKPLFFTSGSYTRSAVSFADNSGVPLFIYSASDGTLLSANTHSERILNTGL